MGENQNIGFRKLSVVESVSSREELAQGTYANSYDLKLKFKEEEKIISKVSHEHYTYFHLLEDCHRVFKIGTDFIDVFSDNGLRITCDNDVDFMFSWYKLECIVPIIVLERYVTIEDGGGPRVSLPGNMISTQKEIVIQKDVITQEEAEFLSLAEGIELAYGVIHGESATRAEEVTQVADVMQAGVTTQTEGVIEEEIITEEELVSMAECVTQAHGVTHAKGIAQAEVTTQTVRGRTTGRGRQIQRSMPNARRCRSLKPPRLNSDDENEPFNEFQFSDSDDNEWMDEDEINETDSDSDSSNSDASNDADFSETTDEDKLSDVGEGDLEKSSSSEDEPESKCTRRKKVRDPLKGLYSMPFTVDKEEEIVFCEGQTFKSIQTFRDILADYSIKGGYIIRKDKNDTKRVTAQCIGADCKWRIHGSLTPDGVTFMVKTLKDDHTCIRAMDNKSAFVTAKWIANKLKDSLYADPDMSYELMEEELRKWGVNPPQWLLYRAKCRARALSEGAHSDSYAKLPKYIELLMNHNPGTVCKFEYEHRNNLNDNPVFKSLFVCIHALKEGFVKGCRPFIGLDGCHLKGPFGGILLVAVSVDGNRGILPLAFAIVDSECKGTWGKFLELLRECIDSEVNVKTLTFMSDRQKGLIDAIKEIFPESHHRSCARHLLMNFKKKFPALALKDEFWAASFATHGFAFWEVMKRIKTYNEKEPFNWLLKIPLSEWSRHLFKPEAKSDHCTNNMTESFNSWINKIRAMPVCKLVDAIRQKCMVRMHRRYAKASTWEGRVTPMARTTINNLIRDSRFCKMFPGRNDEFEVMEGKCRFVVKLREKICSCLWWMRSGIPCKHAMICIGYKREQVENYCDEYFTVDKYLATYNPALHPFPQNDLEEGDIPVNQKLLPPPLKRLPGRPRKARKKQDGETPAGGRIKRSSTIRCKICKQLGHNKRTCGRGLTMNEARNAEINEASRSSHVQPEGRYAESTEASTFSYVQPTRGRGGSRGRSGQSGSRGRGVSRGRGGSKVGGTSRVGRGGATQHGSFSQP